MSRKELLNAVASKVVACKKCDLWKTRKSAVPGEGTIKARIMFIGEAPGQSEDEQGRPFVGAAGKFLDTLLSEAGLLRKEVFITNIVKCRPPRNREPRPMEVETCTPYLDHQIRIIKPNIIVTLGSHATNYIFQKAQLRLRSITQVHGEPCQARILKRDVTVFPTFHPAASLYSARYKEQLSTDFKLLKQKLTQKQPSTT